MAPGFGGVKITQVLTNKPGFAPGRFGKLGREAFAAFVVRAVKQEQPSAGFGQTCGLRPAERSQCAGKQNGLAVESRHNASETSSTLVAPTGLSKTISPRAMATMRSQDWKT